MKPDWTNGSIQGRLDFHVIDSLTLYLNEFYKVAVYSSDTGRTFNNLTFEVLSEKNWEYSVT